VPFPVDKQATKDVMKTRKILAYIKFILKKPEDLQNKEKDL
jgi:hypothetical protein